MRIMAIDYGDARTGIAVSDPTGSLTGYTAVIRSRDPKCVAEEIAALIRGMREPYRPVCQLCLLEEKSPEEAALALGRPVKTIHTQLSRGKRMLREALERSGNDDMLSP